MVQQVARRLQLAVLAMKDFGIQIRRGMPAVRYTLGEGWDLAGSTINGVEPTGALLLHEQPYAEGLLITEHGEAACLLGVGVPWVLEFREGFHTWTSCSTDRLAPYRLGAWFAQEYAGDL